MKHDHLVNAIRRRIKEQGITPYELAQRLKGKVAKATVYNFVGDGKPVRSDTLVAVLDALDLTLNVEGKESK